MMLISEPFGRLCLCLQLSFITGYHLNPHSKILSDDDKTVGGDPVFKPPNETDRMYWPNIANKTLKEKIDYHNKYIKDNKFAKNVIFFLGDGMSIPTITAARIYQGQLTNTSGEEAKLSFERFPVNGLAKTYCVDAQVADSACSGTAYMTGVKNNIGTIGVTSDVKSKDCKAGNNPYVQVSSLIQWAQDVGKGTGIITNTRITDATPAAGYAHVSNRHFESDADVVYYKLNPAVCKDIASQLILDNPGKNVKVLMGGGRTKFIPKEEKDPISGFGERLDKINLIEKWKWDKENNRKSTAKVVYTTEEFNKIDVKNTDYLLGLFNRDHMKYHLESDENIEPSLTNMTTLAIRMLQKEKQGFVLFVEGGRIDMGHHSNQAHIALDETVEFARAIEAAASMTSEEDTLIVVTADHAHTMSISGFPARGTDILKFAGKAADGLLYTSISYANGPGYHSEISPGKRYNISKDNVADGKYQYPATLPLKYETHGGDDVAVFARGPWSHLFTGTYEQNYIPIAEAFAANITSGETPVPISLAETITYSYSTFAFIVLWNVCTHIFL